MLTIVNASNEDWWEGELKGATGLFPRGYVEVLEGDGDLDSETHSINTVSSETDSAIAPPPSLTSQDSGSRVVMMITSAPIAKAKWSDDIDGAILGRLSDKEKRRQEVIFELLQTERDYVRDLELIINLYLNPMRKKKIVSPKDLAVLFSNIEMLVPVNSLLLKTLSDSREVYPIIERVGDIFLKVADYLKMYNMYCGNHPYALLKYETLKSKAFRNLENVRTW